MFTQEKQLKMPGVGFAGLFDSCKSWDRNTKTSPVAAVPSWDSGEKGRRGYTCELSRYCSVRLPSGHASISVDPSSAVVDYFKANVLHVPSDSVYFQIIIRNNGTALITMQHNQIIGSHWLDIVPVDTLPAQLIEGE